MAVIAILSKSYRTSSPSRVAVGIYAAAAALALSGCAASLPFTGGGTAQAASVEGAPITYADAADLVLISPYIVDVTVTKVSRIADEDAPGLRPDSARMLVTASVNTLLRGAGGIPGEVRFLVDWPMDSRGKAAKLKKRRFLVFARPVAGQAGVLQLVQSDSMVEFSGGNDSLIRAATKEAVAINAPAAITGVAQAFHFPGTISGEGETQIFLDTTGGVPVSINVSSRAGTAPLWNVSLGEVVDTQARAPARDTLLWYRLACGTLPTRLPVESLSSRTQAANVKADADYQFVRQALGACPRTRSTLR